MSERDRLRSLHTFFPPAQGSQNPYAGASAALREKVMKDQPFTAEDIANSIRDPVPDAPGVPTGIGRIDPNHPVIKELLKNLPPDLEYVPDHEGAGPTLLLRSPASNIPMS
jgi:hypothetical protein